MGRINLLNLYICSLVILVAVACARLSAAGRFSCQNDTAPAIGETAAAMAACLPANASAEEAEQRLRRWQQATKSHWGGAQAVDILPGGGDELILTYHANLAEVIWNPQGKIAVLQNTAEGWRVPFESPDPTAERMDGRQTLAGNWSFHPAAVGDVTGDGLADLLLEQRWSNGTHAYVSYTKLLTADSAGSESLRVIYLEVGSHTHPRYQIDGQAVKSIIAIDNQAAITRTYRLAGDSFALAAQAINPAAAVLSATTNDGSDWYAYDRQGSAGAPHYGLYRLQDGRLDHFAVPFLITSLKVLRDDRLYVAGVGEDGGAVMQLEAGMLVDVLADKYAPIDSDEVWLPRDMALAANGDLWLAGVYRLLRLGRTSSLVYPYLVTSLLVAPDDSLWAAGWDGIADSNCCYFHIDGESVTQYNRSEPLPVAAGLDSRFERCVKFVFVEGFTY